MYFTNRLHKEIKYKLCLLFLLILYNHSISLCSEITVKSNLDGSPGIVEVPISGSFDDGQLTFSSSKFGPYLKNSLSFQAIPNAFIKFNYEGMGDKNILYYGSTGYTTWDRSIDLRFNLSNEKLFLPSLTVGINDIAGTGRNASEYIVASKDFKQKIRYTVGLGWGRYGSKHIIGNSGNRVHRGGLEGGQISLDHLFRGNIGVFGGIEYKTNLKNIILGAEIASDNYKEMADYTDKLPISSINYSAKYKISEGINLGAYWVHGNSAGIQINFSANPLSYGTGDYLEDAPEPFYSLPLPNIHQNNVYRDKLIEDLLKYSIRTVSYGEKKDEAIIVIANNHYQSDAQSIGRTLRALSKFIPIDISTFTVIISELGIPITQISLNRHDVSMIIDAPNSEILTKKITKINNAPKQIENLNYFNDQGKFSWLLRPYYRLHLFDPNNPVYYDFGPRLYLNYIVKPGFLLRSTTEKSMVSTFDEIWRGEKGQLPHVRTELKKYLNVQETRIRDLTASSYYKLNNRTYGRFTLGYLESMYSGLSTEILSFNDSNKFAIGAEVNYVKAREFKQLLGHRDVKGLSKVNGHVSGYWDTGYKNYFAQVDIGQYLAGDKGGTLTVSRRFPNGWNIGGFFTLTDASFSEFGEGSFDKGIFLKLPFNSIIPYNTRSFLYEEIRPIQGDGGSRVKMEGRLYGMLESRTKNNLNKSWAMLWR